MFAISRKSAFLRASIIGVIIIAVISIASIFVINKNNGGAHANTDDGGTVSVYPGAPIGYGTWMTNEFTVYTDGKSFPGMCADPNLSTPSGNWPADLINSESYDQKRIKLMLYIFFVDTPENQAYLSQIFVEGMTYQQKYGYAHAIVGYLNSGSSIGLNEGEMGWVNTVIAQLGSYVTNNDIKWQRAEGYHLYTTNNSAYPGLQRIMWIEGKDIQYGEITVNKKDGDTNSCTDTTGSLSLNGTTFDLIDSNNERVETKSISNGCNVTFSNVPYGTYTIRETTATNGYNRDSDKSITLSSSTASTTFSNTPKKNKITVNKIDADTGTCTTTAALSFKNITFTLINKTGGKVKYGSKIISDDNIIDSKSLSDNSCSVVFENLPYGQYTIQESNIPAGYSGDSDKSITLSGSDATVSFSNSPKKGKITVTKTDSETGSCNAVGDITLSGTKFTLYNKTGGTIKVGNQTFNDNAEIASITLNDNNNCTVTFNGLPYGDYSITETPSRGYNANTATKTVTLAAAATSVSFANTSIKGKITINKKDINTNSCTPQGNATLEGTKFTIVNDSQKSIYYNGHEIAKNHEIATGTIDPSTCQIVFNNLPYGTYKVMEKTASTGYKTNTEIKTVTITNNSTNVVVDYKNVPILGKVTVNKTDADTGTCTNSGALTFEGVTFTITNNSAKPIYYNNSWKNQNDVIETKVMTADDCSVTFENLPYGSYIVKETRTSEGYQLNSTPQTVTIPTNNTVNVKTTFANQPIRGDIKFVKMDTTNNKPMRDVLFSISAIDKDYNIIETHIVVSNQNGVVDTSSSFVPHSNHTNGYDALFDEVDPISFSGFGTWFGLDKNGNSVPVKDSVGALPYGTYIIQELRCGSNLFCYGILNQKITVKINSANQVINLGDWDNACTNFSLETTAVDAEDDDKYIEIDQEVNLKDIVDYCVKPNTDFTLKGILMDKSTGEPLIINGETVESSVKLRSETECGQTEMIFTFDASELGGKELVVFETLYYKENIITKHDDIDDLGQTIELVYLRTFATNDATDEKTLPLNQDVVIKDEVKYCLKPGEEYTVKGILMNKNTGNGLLINSEPVEAEITFTPEESCGQTEMYFKFNTADLGGADLVVFESLYRNDELMLEHRDLENIDETVSVAPPAPDTGFMTRIVSDGGNTGHILYIAGGIIFLGIGGYFTSRYFSKKNFLKRK
ncbi:VaFE repeat-containing surface-anchored protein [Candidatus Saccharibacteria bacterium]|nr:VaFE repeat-containing surface-anchored protein [Candidatus Saccharibacteria bacterium]